MASKNLGFLVSVLLVIFISFSSFSILAIGQEAPKQTEITFMTWAGGEEITMLESKIKRFEFINPDIKVKMLVVPSAQYLTKMLSMHVSGDPPDVAYYSQTQHKIFADKELLVDLWPYVKDDKVWLNDYRPFLLKIHTHGGKYVGTSLGGWGTAMLFYNKDLLAKSGVKVPTTMDAYLKAAQKLTKDTNGDGRTDIFGTQVSGDTESLVVFIEAFGGNIFNEDRTEVLIDKPEAIEGLQFMGDLINKYKVAPPFVGTPGGVGFRYGNIAMGIYGIWSNGFLYREIGGKFKFDIAPNPKGPTGILSAPLTSSAYGVATGSKHKEEAVRFAKFMASAPGQIENAYMGFAASSNPSIDRIFANTPVWQGKNYTAVAKTAEYGKIAPFNAPNWEECLRIITKYRDLVLMGKSTAKEACTQAAKELREAIKKAPSE